MKNMGKSVQGSLNSHMRIHYSPMYPLGKYVVTDLGQVDKPGSSNTSRFLASYH